MTAPSATPREPQPLRVPPAQVHIPAEDRAEILRRIDEAMASGQLTLAAIGPDTAAVVVVHIGGLVTPAIHELRALCDEHGISLFEDAAHAHGSSLGGQSAGTFGVASSFSFYPTKVITAAEGGIILTDDEHLADEARAYRDQGKASFTANVHTHLGYNWRMSEPHAAIAVSQLARLDEFISHRQLIAKVYDEGLSELPLTPLDIPADASCNYYKYVAYLPDGIDRAELK